MGIKFSYELILHVSLQTASYLPYIHIGHNRKKYLHVWLHVFLDCLFVLLYSHSGCMGTEFYHELILYVSLDFALSLIHI